MVCRRCQLYTSGLGPHNFGISLLIASGWVVIGRAPVRIEEEDGLARNVAKFQKMCYDRL